MTVSHDSLAKRLANHLGGSSDRLVWFDMQLGPAGSPRPDVWTLNKSYSSPKPLAYEVKATKADYQRDVAAGKWQSYLRYSCSVTFAVPIGMVSKADLPKGCGLMVWNGECWTTTKAPTLNPCPELPRDLMMKLLIDGAGRAAERCRVRARTEWHAHQTVLKKFGKTVAEIVSEETGFEDRLEAVRQRYRKAEADEKARYDSRRAEADRVVTRAYDGLCKAIGLAEGADPYEMQSRMWDLARAVSRDAEVEELRYELDLIRRALESADKTPNRRLLASDPGEGV